MGSISNKKQTILKSIKEKDLVTAKKLCMEILADSPLDTTILSLLGTLNYNLKNYDEAIKYLEKSASLKNSDKITQLLGLSYYEINNWFNAYKYFSMLDIKKMTTEILQKTVTILYREDKETFKAIEYAMELYRRSPFDNENLLNLGYLCLKAGKFNDSIKFCNQLIKNGVKNGHAWILKGLVEEVVFFNIDESRKCFKKAIRLGAKPDAYYNLAISWERSDRKKSNYYAKKALNIVSKDNAEEIYKIIRDNYFAQRKLKVGYRYYKHILFNSELFPIEKSWDGKPHKNSVFCLPLTDGFGDQIMFIRYLPMISKKFKEVKVICKNNLIELFKYVFEPLKNVQFLPDEKGCEFDYYTCMFHLPALLNISFNKIPSTRKYLYCDCLKIKELKNKYFKTNKLKVGLCWEAGGTALRFLLNRTIPLQIFEKILRMKDIQLYSLQKDSVYINTDLFKNSSIIDIGSNMETFYDTAAAIMNLDVLITVDTSVAHLGGALGVKTFMLLPQNADWRWFDEDKNCNWYDSVEIFKQTNPPYWDNTIEQIIQKIQIMID